MSRRWATAENHIRREESDHDTAFPISLARASQRDAQGALPEIDSAQPLGLSRDAVAEVELIEQGGGVGASGSPSFHPSGRYARPQATMPAINLAAPSSSSPDPLRTLQVLKSTARRNIARSSSLLQLPPDQSSARA